MASKQSKEMIQKRRMMEELNILKTIDKVKDTHYLLDKRFIQGPLRNLLVSYGILLDKEGYYDNYYHDSESRKKSKEILKKSLENKYESFLRLKTSIQQDDNIYDLLIILGGNSQDYHRSFRKKKLRQFIQKSEVSHLLLTKNNNEELVKIGEDPTRKEM